MRVREIVKKKKRRVGGDSRVETQHFLLILVELSNRDKTFHTEVSHFNLL